jgi:hypothetical protein
MEMRIVLQRVLQRAALRPADATLEKITFRGITLAPANGVQVVQDRAPAAVERRESEEAALA